jgi:hypothetical protein
MVLIFDVAYNNVLAMSLFEKIDVLLFFLRTDYTKPIRMRI